MINELKPNQIFVFGSNLDGHHLGGAARQAYDQFGALWGVGIGLMGQSYAIPTMFETAEEIRPYVEQFNQLAGELSHKTFLLTKIGCGIAGFEESDIAPLFKDSPSNVLKPKGW